MKCRQKITLQNQKQTSLRTATRTIKTEERFAQARNHIILPVHVWYFAHTILQKILI